MLKETNLRMTRQRRVILEELRKMDGHPTADKIYAVVRKRLPKISLGTVYRNLEVLSVLGEIHKLELSGSQKRFDCISDFHYHIRCTCCDRVDDAPMGPLKDFENRINGETSFKVLGHRIEFVGLCPDCRENPTSPGLKKFIPPNHLRVEK